MVIIKGVILSAKWSEKTEQKKRQGSDFRF